MVAGEAVFPTGLLRAIQNKWFSFCIKSFGLEYYRENLYLNAQVYLDAHALKFISDLISIAHVREERRSNDSEDFISSIAFTAPGLAAWIPEPAENDNVHVVDVVDGGLLTVRTLQKGHWLQLSC